MLISRSLDGPKTLPPNDALVSQIMSATWPKESEDVWFFVERLGVSQKGSI